MYTEPKTLNKVEHLNKVAQKLTLWPNPMYRFPRLKICFAHGGGSFPYTVGRVQHGYNVRPDLCATDCDLTPREFLGKFWTDSLVHDDSVLKLLVDVIG